MKSSSIFSIVLLFSFIKFASSHLKDDHCVDYPDFYTSSYEVNKCSKVNKFISDDNGKYNNSITVDIGDNESKPGMCKTGGKVNMFDIDFTCDGNASNETCQKAKDAFETAGMIVSSAIKLNTRITVNAYFMKFCGVVLDCGGKPGPLGSGRAARLIQLKGDDGVVRLYPQSLVKQFNLSSHPEYSKYDIVAGFNSESTVFWFSGDPNPPTSDQVEFTMVVVHELIHGLGCATLWADYFNPTPQALEPFPSFITNPETNTGYNGTVTFTGFQESIFDKHLVFTGSRDIRNPDNYLTNLRKKINSRDDGIKANTKFDSSSEFTTAFQNSSNCKLAKGMFTKAITPKSLGFLPHDARSMDDVILLETSLNPFITGSNLHHLDNATYANTLDFVMRWRLQRGVTLETLYIANGGNKEYTCVIGPNTIKILETMGYETTTKSTLFRRSESSNSSLASSPFSINKISNIISTFGSLILSSILII